MREPESVPRLGGDPTVGGGAMEPTEEKIKLSLGRIPSLGAMACPSPLPVSSIFRGVPAWPVATGDKTMKKS
jgi:hypothetical protein